MAISIQLKRGPSANLGNITPKDGEIVWLTDEKRFRIGSDDGTTQAWNALNYAQLDATTGLVPSTQLPIDDTAGAGDTDKLWSADKILSTLTSGAQYKGLWQADTDSDTPGPGTPALADGSGNNGDFYIVEVGGDASFDGGTTTINFKPGDRILYEESVGKWQKVVSPDNVDSVNGQTGVVSLGLGDMTDVIVDSGTLAADDYIKWDPTANGGNGAWVNAAPQTLVIDDLADVDTTTTAPTTGQVLKWDGTNWIPGDDNNTVASLNDIGDVNVPSPTNNQILSWDDTNSQWIAVDAGSVTASTFISLSDTPSAYNSGDAGKFVQVNSTEDGLVFTDYTLANLIDVDVSGAAKGDVLSYNSIKGLWEPAPDSDTTYTAGLGISIDDTNNNAINLDASIDLLTDVDTTTTAPNTDDVLSWDGSNWVPTSLDGGTF